jgi:hypothetical protein
MALQLSTCKDGWLVYSPGFRGARRFATREAAQEFIRAVRERRSAIKDHACQSVTTPDGHGAYCATCGEVTS